MKRYAFNKLIRSKLPNRMEKEGVCINSKHLTADEYLTQLKNKMIEEALEVQEAKTLNNIIRELADVMEVIHAIAEVIETDIKTIEKERLKKRSVNGHFLPVNYINYIEVAMDNHKVIEYLENKDRPYKYN